MPFGIVSSSSTVLVATAATGIIRVIKDAVASAGGHRLSPRLDAPATPESILRAYEDLRRRLAETDERTGTGAR